MNIKYFLTFSLFCLATTLAVDDNNVVESQNASSTSSPVPDRTGRKFYPQKYADPDRNTAEGTPYVIPPQGSPRALPNRKHVVPYKHTASGAMKKSGANLNWSVWKGDNNDNDDNDDSSDSDETPKWPTPNAWNNDPWMSDPMFVLMLKNAMSDIKGDNKPTGILSKLGSDPALLLIAASIPISLLLAAVLPAIMNHLMNGSSIPTISTTATGSKARNSQVDVMPYLSPVLEAIGTFGIRSITNPECMQKIFCQVAQDKFPFQKSSTFRNAVSVAQYLSDGSWLENYGMKDLVDALGNGKCENIPCSQNPKMDSIKTRYSRKLNEEEKNTNVQ